MASSFIKINLQLSKFSFYFSVRNPCCLFQRIPPLPCSTNSLTCQYTTESKRKEHIGDQKEVVIKREEVSGEPVKIEVKWENYKRAWKHFQKRIDVLKSLALMKEDTHEGRLRQRKQDHVVYYFRTKKDLDNWYVMTDEDMGGHSWAELTQGPNEMTAVFRGYLNQKPPQSMFAERPKVEVVKRFMGTAYLETKPFFTILDKKEYMSLEHYNCIKMRIRGDGRRYIFETVCDGSFGHRIPFTYPIYTRGGPLWEEIEIPYMKLMSRKEGEGMFLLRQRRLDLNKVENFRFLLNDKVEGPFQLEIDYIALVHNKKFSYDYNDVHNPWEPINANSGS